MTPSKTVPNLMVGPFERRDLWTTYHMTSGFPMVRTNGAWVSMDKPSDVDPATVSLIYTSKATPAQLDQIVSMHEEAVTKGEVNDRLAAEVGTVRETVLHAALTREQFDELRATILGNGWLRRSAQRYLKQCASILLLAAVVHAAVLAGATVVSHSIGWLWVLNKQAASMFPGFPDYTANKAEKP